MFTVSVLKEYPSKTGGYFYTGMVKVDNEMSFFPRVNRSEDGKLKVSLPSHVSILSEAIADSLTSAFTKAVTSLRDNPEREKPEEFTFGGEKVISSIEEHLTPNKDGTPSTVYENTKYNRHASITFDFANSAGEKMFGIDTTLRSRSDGSGKFIALPSKLGSDGKYYKEVSCSRAISDQMNEKGIALYEKELMSKQEREEKNISEPEPEKKIPAKSAPTR